MDFSLFDGLGVCRLGVSGVTLHKSNTYHGRLTMAHGNGGDAIIYRMPRHAA